MSDRRPARGEFELIDAVRRAAAGTPGAGVSVSIGDDAAVLELPPGHELVVTTDLLVEGRHFRLGEDGAAAEDVGWKALAVSISDVAAMGARALWAVVAVGLPAQRTGAFADGLTAGLVACADRYGVALVGGDTTCSPGSVVVDTTVLGSVSRGCAVLRSGARPEDAICVTGALGGSLAGRHLRPHPRQVEALSLVQGGAVHAMIDLSDGLSSDLGHVLDASGAGAEVWADRLPVHADARAAARDSGRDPIEHALHDGEDFELLFTIPTERADELAREGLAGTPVSVVGRITGPGPYVLRPSAGSANGARPMERGGHDHFRTG